MALTPERQAEIRAALDAVPAPPWQWIGDRRTGPMLTTTHSGWEYLVRVRHPEEDDGGDVVDSQGRRALADLDFRDQRDGEQWAILRPAKEMAVGRTQYDPDTIRDIDNPVARWMRDAPQYVAELLAEVEELRAQRAALIKLHEYDELIFGGFYCTHCTPDDPDSMDDPIAWPCPSLRAVGMTDDEAIGIITEHRAAIEKAHRAGGNHG